MRRLLSLDCVLEYPHLPWRQTELGRQPPIYDIELDSPSLENAVNIGELARELVRKALKGLVVTDDVTDDVFLAIERDPELLREYCALLRNYRAGLASQGRRTKYARRTIHGQIAKQTASLTSRRNGGEEVDPPRSCLINSYHWLVVK